MQKLDAETLKSRIAYDADTGAFTWTGNAPKRSPVRPGELAGWVAFNGYRYIGIGGVQFLAHRLAWLYVHGVWPTEQIDHIDGDRLNNRVANLREAANRQNSNNTGAKKVLF